MRQQYESSEIFLKRNDYNLLIVCIKNDNDVYLVAFYLGSFGLKDLYGHTKKVSPISSSPFIELYHPQDASLNALTNTTYVKREAPLRDLIFMILKIIRYI